MNNESQRTITVPNVPQWMANGKFKYTCFAIILLVVSISIMVALIPDEIDGQVVDLRSLYGELALWWLKATVQTLNGLFQLGIILVVLAVIFDPLTIRKELMSMLMRWYDQKQLQYRYDREEIRHTDRESEREDDFTDGLKLLAMAILATGTLLAAAILIGAQYLAAFS